MTYQQQITIRTSGHGDMHDLTEQVSAAVATSGILVSQEVRSRILRELEGKRRARG